MPAFKFIHAQSLARAALLALVLALSACADISSRPANQASDCSRSSEEPIQVCDTSVG